jgi:flagellar motility protein MotE (MotC chaperone)
MRQFRILPVTIFCAVLFLSVKIGAVWSALQDTGGTVALTDPVAAAVHPSMIAPAAGSENADGAAMGDAPMAPSEPAGFKDITGFSQSEIDLLQALGERRDQLEVRAEELDQRETLLRAAEQRIDEKVAQLKSIQANIEAMVKTAQENEDADIRRLVKVYETMKPKNAARIFEELDQEVLIEVALRMKEARLAPILASMDPMRARTVTAELARKRSIPDFALPPPEGG